MNLSGKTVLITGAAGALGQVAAKVAESSGASVVRVDLSFPPELEKDNTFSLDLLKLSSVKDCISQLPRVDAVLNIAGGFSMGSSLYEMPANDWDKMFALNVQTTRNMIEAVTPLMVTQGRGSIVNVGAVSALSGVANMSAYCASKSVVMNMTQSLSEEVKHQGINVNAVLPSIIDTPANRSAMPDANYSEWVTPQQLANTMCFLASDDASGIHGALIPVRGLS